MRIKSVVVGILFVCALIGRAEPCVVEHVKWNTSSANPRNISGYLTLNYAPFDWDDKCVVKVDGKTLLIASTNMTNSFKDHFNWMPHALGTHTLEWSSGGAKISTVVNVQKLAFAQSPENKPPMSKVSTQSITPTTRSFDISGGGGAIIVSGSGNWTAASSSDWIQLNATSGAVGTPVAYMVTANTNVGSRTGYVWVSGYSHTVTQAGRSATVSPMTFTIEKDGTTSKNISIDPSGAYAWDAYPTVDWIYVSTAKTHGIGAATIPFAVAPLYEVTTRTGTIVVGDKTVTVTQYGQRMELSDYTASCDYLTHVFPITINALSSTSWTVTPNDSWISVVDAGNGHGGDSVTVSVGENPSWLARTGTVTIGTETFTVVQAGRTALSFALSPATTTAPVGGANGMASITATPDLPWTATCNANWVTFVSGFSSGSGNGNVVYNVSPNNTLSSRTATITVTPGDSRVAAKTHKITQPAATASISPTSYEFPSGGGQKAVTVTVGNNVGWTISNPVSWITFAGGTSRTGPATLTLQAAANDTVNARSGTVTIAGKKFTVSQKGRGVEVEYDNIVFGTDGGDGSFSVHPDGNVAWTAVASDPSWIVVFGNASGTGDAEVSYIIAPYQGTGGSRTGTIKIGDKTIYVTQRAYSLTVSPNGTWVPGNAGAGSFGVTATQGAIWEAIVTAPWITIVSGYDSGTGSGTVRYSITENNTGLVRTGKIIVSGTPYEVTQGATLMQTLTTAAQGGGTVDGGGSYERGETVSVTAVPNAGYRFLRWTGASTSTANPVSITMNADKSLTAVFGPIEPSFTKATSSTAGVTLTWNTLAWATQYKIYRGLASGTTSNLLVTISSGSTGTYCDASGTVSTDYKYWIQAIGNGNTVSCTAPATGHRVPRSFEITYVDALGATHSNPPTYLEGSAFTFSAPDAVVGYAFKGWTPSGITASTVGAVTAKASWTTNQYTVVFQSNGGTGTMANETFSYGVSKALTSNGFTRTGHTFVGWATSANGAPTYSNGQKVSNLSATNGAKVSLYAIWSPNNYLVSFNANGGQGSMDGELFVYGTPQALSRNVFTRTGYGFGGWATSAGGSKAYDDGQTVQNLTEAPSGTVTLYATWIPTYKVVFNANGGSGTMGNESFRVGSAKALTANGFTRTGYTFAGWATSAGGPKSYDNGQSVLDLTTTPGGTVTLYAVWTPNAYTVVFNANGGSGTMANEAFTYGTEKALTANKFTYDGFLFAGWSTTTDGNAVYADGQPVLNLLDADGAVLTLFAVWNPEILENPTVTPTEFIGDRCMVSISCATLGASIYYSTIGTPRTAEAFLYKGPFEVTADTTTVRAIAVKGARKSEYVTATVTRRHLTIAEAVDAPTLVFMTGGDAEWNPTFDETAPMGDTSARSGTIGTVDAGSESWVQTTVQGIGTLTFRWKVDCEHDESDDCSWDHLACIVDGNETEEIRIDGQTEWEQVEIPFQTEEAHTVRWVYRKDFYDEPDASYDDCGWIDGVSFVLADPIPELNIDATPEKVFEALTGSTDERLTQRITNAVQYAAYRAFADKLLESNGISHAEVKAHPSAWMSYALDADSLVCEENLDGHLRISEFKSDSMKGKWEVSVVLEGVSIGDAAMEENLRKVFTLEGTKTLNEIFSSESAGKTVFAPSNGILRITVEMSPEETDSFFLRVRMLVDVHSYTVIFHANGGSGTMPAESFTWGVPKALTANEFTKTGQIFAGWAMSENSETSFGDRQVVSNLVSNPDGTIDLYANWDWGGVQLWENGPYWAECNVGATKPEEYGYYFRWGDTVGCERVGDSWNAVDGTQTAFSVGNCPTYEKDNSQLQSEGWIDGSGNLVAAHDAATAHLGAPWRMPTDAEWGDLISHCDTEWTTRNGVSGRLVKGRGAYASKSIFLPAAGFGYESDLNYTGSYGYYWSSTPISDYSSRAWYLYFRSGNFNFYQHGSGRSYGQSVRPLRGFAQ